MKKTILPPLKLPVIKEGSVSSKDTPTPKTELRFIAQFIYINRVSLNNKEKGNQMDYI